MNSNMQQHLEMNMKARNMPSPFCDAYFNATLKNDKELVIKSWEQFRDSNDIMLLNVKKHPECKNLVKLYDSNTNEQVSRYIRHMDMHLRAKESSPDVLESYLQTTDAKLKNDICLKR